MTADQAPTGERRRPPDLWPQLHHRTLAIRLNGAPMITGEMVAFTLYEVVIKTANGKSVMVPKHSIVSVDLPADWRRSPAPDVAEEVTA
jgi:hypothetical protein